MSGDGSFLTGDKAEAFSVRKNIKLLLTVKITEKISKYPVSTYGK